MAASISELGSYLRSQEFRLVGSEVIIQILIGFVDAFILAVVTLLFGVSS